MIPILQIRKLRYKTHSSEEAKGGFEPTHLRLESAFLTPRNCPLAKGHPAA
jgi:hypothetical protein